MVHGEDEEVEVKWGMEQEKYTVQPAYVMLCQDSNTYRQHSEGSGAREGVRARAVCSERGVRQQRCSERSGRR